MKRKLSIKNTMVTLGYKDRWCSFNDQAADGLPHKAHESADLPGKLGPAAGC